MPRRNGLQQLHAMPGVGFKAPIGQTLGFDLVEVNPILDTGNRPAPIAVEVALSALGKRVWAPVELACAMPSM